MADVGGDMAEKELEKPTYGFWIWVMGSVILRLFFIFFFPENFKLSSRPEVSTPLTSVRRRIVSHSHLSLSTISSFRFNSFSLFVFFFFFECSVAEGYWLKQSSMSPYAGSMYHGSPLLLSVLGPLTSQRIEGQSSHHLCSLVFVFADILSALLLRAIGHKLQKTCRMNLKRLGVLRPSGGRGILPCGDIAALVYLWNPFTILSCVGLSTSPIENLAVIVSLYGAVTRRVPLAAFGLIIATHLSLYPASLAIPLILLLGYGLDAPPLKIFLHSRDRGVETGSTFDVSKQDKLTRTTQLPFLWRTVLHFVFWLLLLSICLLVLCSLSLKQYGGLEEMFKRTYSFILSIEDLSPNIGVFWYFFAEAFEFSRNYLLIVFNLYILLTSLPPLAFRFKHRPCFLAFAYLVMSSIIKSYPSGGDAALYLSLWALFVNELSDMNNLFFILCGHIGFSLLSPVVHNIWIWRGTGNANFYFGNAIGYAGFQFMFVEESVNAMLDHDKALEKATSNHKLVTKSTLCVFFFDHYCKYFRLCMGFIYIIFLFY